MKLKHTILTIKLVSLTVLGLIVFSGNLGPSIIGGLWACPFPIPFIMCNVCSTRCVFGQIRQGLFYGILGSGFIIGRGFCGIFCPMGIAQEMVAKVPLIKFSMPSNLDKVLRYVKYLFALFFLGLIVEATGVWTGLPIVEEVWYFLTIYNDAMRFALLLSIPLFLIIAIFLYRAWCKYLCPVGTWISPLNRFSLVGLQLNSKKCLACGLCDHKCSLPLASYKGEDVWESIECVRCLQCYTECPNNCSKFRNRLYDEVKK